MSSNFLQLFSNNINSNIDDHLQELLLPFDIKTEITSYLSQSDCLTCMTVCRTWQKQIPQYAQPVWSQLRLHSSNIVLPYHQHQLWEQCIGRHVKSVVFDSFQLEDDEERLYTTICKLIDNRCDRIQSIEFIDCNTRNEVLLLELLKKLASSSTIKLQFTRHSTDLYLAHLIHTCPNLTHFSYSRSYYNGFRKNRKRRNITTAQPYIARPESPFLPMKIYCKNNNEQQPQFPKLIHFKVESRCSDPTVLLQINHILQHSPSLEYFTYELRNDGLFTFCNDLVSIDLKQILLSCPNLRYLRGNVSDDDFIFSKHTHYKDIESYSTVNVSNKKHQQQQYNGGLRYFLGCETKNYGPEKMEHYLLHNESTLDFLLFKGSMPAVMEPSRTAMASMSNWTHLLQSIHAPRLRKLVFYNTILDNNPDSIPIMTSNCPMLEELVLEAYSPNNQRTMALDIIRLATNTKQLQRLMLAGITIHVNYHVYFSLPEDEEQQEENKGYNNQMEKIFKATWVRLQDIYISNVHLTCPNEMLFYKSLTCLPQLKYLKIPKRLALAVTQ
ncbi:hypothetical protein BDA99DRAFT_527877 [Phascolomyces articulosus]|uniref:F-box domain-containing protein n=1 Tax=Phascolomyces articulosus TaxID=60185 RepID=A0AAD5JMI3_9FUNG|nr:hypothetical protein BDA99DRAFT_527877 [Phascolomyces articulosus]